MKVIKILFSLVIVFLFSSTVTAQNTKYKCMLQMSTYMGDGAYIVVSIINNKNEYDKTLYVLGSDKKWYKSLKEWFKYYNAKKPDINAVTGASITGGDRSVKVFEIENSKIDKDYKLRFESAVEDEKYFAKDIEIPLTSAYLSTKTDGSGYIKFVRFSKVQ